MEPTQLVAAHEAIERDQHLVHTWRVTQLKRLGIPEPLAEADADNVDWHLSPGSSSAAARRG